MIKTKLLFGTIFVLISVTLFGQGRALTVDNLVNWKRITERTISDDGKWIACKMEPWDGDASVLLYNNKGEKVLSLEPATDPGFSFTSQYLLAMLTTSRKETDSLKLKKTKPENMPLNRLMIYNLRGKEEIVDSIRSFKLSEHTDWLAYQRGNKKDSTLFIRSLDGSKAYSFPAVTDYGFAKEGNTIYFVSKGDTLGKHSGLYVLTPGKENETIIHAGNGVYKKLTFDKPGKKLAFLYCADKDSASHDFALFISTSLQPAEEIAQKGNQAFPDNYIISENGSVRFSDNSERLFFGIAPRPLEKDTTILPEYRPDVQIWNWNEGVQYTQQSYNKDKDLKKSYTAVFNLTKKILLPLASDQLPTIQTTKDGDAIFALGITTIPYDLHSMWRGKDKMDLYIINVENGDREKIKEGTYGSARLSPKGKYAYWYDIADSCWYSYSIEKKQEYRLTEPDSFIAWEENNDMPDYPKAHGIAGWLENDEALLIYDRYDIWKFDPEAKFAPANLTVNGRSQWISYRFVELDKEANYIDAGKTHLLIGNNEKTKGYGYYSTRFNSPSAPKELIAGNYTLKVPEKAKNSDAVIYTMETFSQYPDLHLSDMSFKKSIRLTDGYKQQEGFKWGTAELVKWVSLDGKEMEGVVYKPDDFDPRRKYPLVVNFYERNAYILHSYRMPEPHRSTIDYHMYNSNDYIIFNPDIVYTEGYPGESCYNSVMPGIASLIQKGYINEKAIGAQGHSWGGYQVAYLATRTDLFAAIESGAPVVNMFSAYGGIRWGSGRNRSFQYEHGQSRIGGTPWTHPLRYIENSPLFTMDKVETPILIMHNDADGHVPWYQGIEYFIALKRLQKPVWLLNYPGEPHWPDKTANKIDFQIRMLQFFDHYLKGKPMPKWMSEGIPAVMKDFDLGY